MKRPSISIHRLYYNGRKRIYCFNDAVVIEHDSMFIFVDARYAASFHDARVLGASDLGDSWQIFTFHLTKKSRIPLNTSSETLVTWDVTTSSCAESTEGKSPTSKEIQCYEISIDYMQGTG